jgi:hypothetical protein
MSKIGLSRSGWKLQWMDGWILGGGAPARGPRFGLIVLLWKLQTQV